MKVYTISRVSTNGLNHGTDNGVYGVANSLHTAINLTLQICEIFKDKVDDICSGTNGEKTIFTPDAIYTIEPFDLTEDDDVEDYNCDDDFGFNPFTGMYDEDC